jgi:hypothetical protein
MNWNLLYQAFITTIITISVTIIDKTNVHSK